MSGCECVCVDAGDGYTTTLNEKYPIAKKRHKCGECGRDIVIGERYEYYVGVNEGKLFIQKTCADCQSIRNEFFCGIWTWGGKYCGICPITSGADTAKSLLIVCSI